MICVGYNSNVILHKVTQNLTHPLHIDSSSAPYSQVARNQKTPQKRREAQPQDHVDNSAAPIRDSDSYARSENKQTDSSQSQSGSYSALRTEHCKSHKPEPKSAGGGAQAHGKKRRPRIAANLNFS